MPLPNDDLLSEERREFCLALKTARERKGVTLAHIAHSTKIPAFMFEGLERNDLRRWPKGLFRRSFFRDYARVIGLPADACTEFVRLFPDVHTVVLAIAPGTTPVPHPHSSQPASDVKPQDEVRLVLDEAWHGARAPVMSRLLIAVSDAVLVLMMSAIGWLAGLDVASSIAIVAFTYFSVATATLGQSPATWMFSRRHDILAEVAPIRVAVATAWKGSADVISQGFVTDDETPPEPSPRLRVRIKVPQ